VRGVIRRLLTTGLLVALVANLLLAGLRLWGGGGQTTTLEIVNRGGAYQVLIDGEQMVPQLAPGQAPFPIELDAPVRGTVTLLIPAPVASLPSPSGIDSVRVTDPDLRELYFQDDFDELNLGSWEIQAGNFTIEDGVLVAKSETSANILALKSRGWEDYRLTVTFRNGRGGTIGVHAGEAGGAYYNFELQRDFPNFLYVTNRGGQWTGTFFGGFVHVREGEVLRSLASMVASSYPSLLLALAGGAALAFALGGLGQAFTWRLPAVRLRLPWALDWPTGFAVVLAVAAFAATLYVSWEHYGRIPHVPDEVAYMFQAKLFAAGRLMGDVPPVREFFYFYYPQFLYENGDSWASAYPFGQPLVLAPGALLGAAWLMPPLVGAGSVLLVYAVGRRLFGALTGVLGAALFAASPFFLMQASSFMSHSTTAFFLLLSLLFILKRERPVLYGALGGLALGFAANTRPLDAFVVGLVYGALLLAYLAPTVGASPALRRLLAFGVGAGVMGILYLAYNFALTGDPLTFPYTAGTEESVLGFTEGHTLDVGLRNEQAQLMALLLVLNGWPSYVGLAFVLLPFVLGTRNRWDYFLLAGALLPMAAYTLYRYSGVFEGPRYWYAALPFLALLSARGAVQAARLIGEVAARLWRRLKSDARPAGWAGAVLVGVVLAALVIDGAGGWLFSWNGKWHETNVALVPHEAKAVSAAFGVDDRLVRLAEKTTLRNALVLVRPCGFFESVHCYGSVFLENSLDFDGDVVWARYIAGRNAEIIAAYPGRSVYVANWDGATGIVPFDPAVDR